MGGPIQVVHLLLVYNVHAQCLIQWNESWVTSWHWSIRQKGHGGSSPQVILKPEKSASWSIEDDNVADHQNPSECFSDNLFHESQVDDAENFNDAKTPEDEAGGREGWDVEGAETCQHNWKILQDLTEKLDARQNSDWAHRGAAHLSHDEHVLEDRVVQAFRPKGLVPDVALHQVVNRVYDEEQDREDDHPGHADGVHAATGRS